MTYGKTREEYNEMIKDLVLSREGQVITVQDFRDATGLQAPLYYVRDLTRDGYLIKKKLPGKGHVYTYKWFDNPTPPTPVGDIDLEVINQLYELHAEWTRDAEENDSAIAGSLRFINYIRGKISPDSVA